MIFYAVVYFIGLTLLIWANLVEPYFYELNRYTIKIKKPLPRPIKILHLTDTHFYKKKRRLTRFFKRLSREEVDLILLTGDIMDCEPGVYICLEYLKRLKTRHGFFAVFGNHDYYNYRFPDPITHNFKGQNYPEIKNSIELFRRELEGGGVRVMMNETDEIKIDGTPILIHGLDDPTTGHDDMDQIIKNQNPNVVNILLTHSVDALISTEDGLFDLSLSGHSHGGQIRFPWIGPVVTHTSLGKKFACGIHEFKKAICCIGRGLGSSRSMQLRFLCRPEAILLTVEGN